MNDEHVQAIGKYILEHGIFLEMDEGNFDAPELAYTITFKSREVASNFTQTMGVLQKKFGDELEVVENIGEGFCVYLKFPENIDALDDTLPIKQLATLLTSFSEEEFWKRAGDIDTVSLLQKILLRDVRASQITQDNRLVLEPHNQHSLDRLHRLTMFLPEDIRLAIHHLPNTLSIPLSDSYITQQATGFEQTFFQAATTLK